MRLLVDTNILLRLIEPGHSQHLVCKTAIDRLQIAGHELSIVPQNLYEFWAVATRPALQNGLGLTSSEANRTIEGLQGFFRLLRDERTIVDFWRQLVLDFDVKGKPSHDARLVAAMQRYAIKHLLTINCGDFIRYPFMVAIDPANVVSGAAIL